MTRRTRIPMTPPTLRSLVDDPLYRAYVRKVPSLPATLRHGEPWNVYVLTSQGKWKKGKFATYQQAWPVVMRALRDKDGVVDVSLVSVRWPFYPPDNYVWDDAFFPWCYRCRRPSRFDYCTSHHALLSAPVLTEDDPFRCFYCGVRRAYAPMGMAS